MSLKSSPKEEILQYAFTCETDTCVSFSVKKHNIYLSSSTNGRDFEEKITNLIPNGSGFVKTVTLAYNQHHALVIRPDDRLRASYVAHEGKKELVISAEGNRHTLDFGAMSRKMVGLIEKNVVDPSLRDWVMPNSPQPRAVLLMATLKQYFSYGFSAFRCGIPRVTLEGDRADWVDILLRLEKLKEYGIETIAWYHLLHPVISRFVAAFDASASEENVDFWQRGAPSYYFGWINAFNVFSASGEWLGHQLNTCSFSPSRRNFPETLSADDFWAAYAPSGLDAGLVLDGTRYHRLDTRKLDDNGEILDCVMVAGLFGLHVSSSHHVTLSPTSKDDVVQPVAGWWIISKKVGDGKPRINILGIPALACCELIESIQNMAKTDFTCRPRFSMN
ncbi:hypothetical protein C8R43DRAFT_1087133 [Mycena crocata]|nr:hypothetical protein C8R43DRAFT_1087133 [Mycena crocata]